MHSPLASDWEKHGFVLLSGFFSKPQVEQVERSYSEAWDGRSGKIVVDDLTTNRRCWLSELSNAERAHLFFKVNDLYLEYEPVRQVALDSRIVPLLRDLLGGEVPVLCNTLNLKRGSQQANHVDSLYMTPRTPGHLLATWMALEDVHADSGPLVYYPGSHLIPPYRFSNGGFHFIPSEMDSFRAYYAEEVAKRGLVRTTFQARKGDLFIWHAQLLHGGSSVANPAMTRDSLVSHFYSKVDCEAQGCELVPLNGAYWMRRPPQAIPVVSREPSWPMRWLRSGMHLLPQDWRQSLRRVLERWRSVPPDVPT